MHCHWLQILIILLTTELSDSKKDRWFYEAICLILFKKTTQLIFKWGSYLKSSMLLTSNQSVVFQTSVTVLCLWHRLKTIKDKYSDCIIFYIRINSKFFPIFSRLVLPSFFVADKKQWVPVEIPITTSKPREARTSKSASRPSSRTADRSKNWREDAKGEAWA